MMMMFNPFTPPKNFYRQIGAIAGDDGIRFAFDLDLILVHSLVLVIKKISKKNLEKRKLEKEKNQNE